jgi:hypothetical protein
MRDKNILDEGIKCHETVVVNSLTGKIIGVDFNTQEVRIEINVPAHMVKRPVASEPKPVPFPSETVCQSWAVPVKAKAGPYNPEGL